MQSNISVMLLVLRGLVKSFSYAPDILVRSFFYTPDAALTRTWSHSPRASFSQVFLLQSSARFSKEFLWHSWYLFYLVLCSYTPASKFS